MEIRHRFKSEWPIPNIWISFWISNGSPIPQWRQVTKWLKWQMTSRLRSNDKWLAFWRIYVMWPVILVKNIYNFHLNFFLNFMLNLTSHYRLSLNCKWLKWHPTCKLLIAKFWVTWSFTIAAMPCCIFRSTNFFFFDIMTKVSMIVLREQMRRSVEPN